MDREKKATECKVDSIGSGRAIPIKQVSAPFPLGLERSGEEAPAMLEDGSGRWERPAPQAPARPDLLQNGLAGSPCSPRDSQEFSPIPQFKSIKFSFSY